VKNQHTRFRCLLILSFLLLQFNTVIADVFRSEDVRGNVSFSDQPSANATRIKAPTKSYRYKQAIKRVYDGDTIILENGERIRFLGINTPEIESRYRDGQTGGQTAKKWLQDKIKDNSVFLEYDSEQRDKYDRLLAHVFTIEGEHLNLSLLQTGLATLSIIPPNLRYSSELQQAEQQAEQQGVGIWSMAEYQADAVDKITKNKRNSGWQRILATPTKITHSRKYTRLILTDKVDIRIPKDNVELFPDLDSYLNKELEIRGWVSRSKGHYSILIRHPSALVIKDGAVFVQ